MNFLSGCHAWCGFKIKMRFKNIFRNLKEKKKHSTFLVPKAAKVARFSSFSPNFCSIFDYSSEFCHTIMGTLKYEKSSNAAKIFGENEEKSSNYPIISIT